MFDKLCYPFGGCLFGVRRGSTWHATCRLAGRWNSAKQIIRAGVIAEIQESAPYVHVYVDFLSMVKRTYALSR
jgi:hypothetical protein